jgi:DNA invertase Pin-like site-specific DNA recombinase
MPDSAHPRKEVSGIPAVLYAAKSSPDPRASIPTQLADARAAAEAAGRTVVGEFSDEAASAYRGNRGAELAAAKKAAIAAADAFGRAEIWVQHSDRLARGDGIKADHLIEIWFAMRHRGVGLRSVQDDSNLDDLIRVALIGERNHEDSRRKSEAVKAGKRRQLERGQRLGGPIPDGYAVLERRHDPGGRLVDISYRLDPERASVIRLIFDLYEQGLGDPSVARELNRRGLRTKAGRPWDRRRVQDTLRNRWYGGWVVRDRGKPTEDHRPSSHPALIEPERFERLLRLRDTRDRGKGSERSPRGRPRRNHALAGLARCARCGEQMRPVTSTYKRVGDGSRRRTYLCANVRAATGLCDQPSIDAEIVDSAVVANLEGYLIDFEAWRRRIEDGQADERERLVREVETANADRDRQARKTHKVEAKWAEYVDANDPQADLVLPMIAREREALESAEWRLRAATDALASIPTGAPTDAMLDFYNGLAAAVRGRLESADSLARVNEALGDLFDQFILNSAEQGVSILPLLSEAAVSRIVGMTQLTQDDQVLELTLPKGQADALIDAVEEGEPIDATITTDVHRVLATGVEDILPPLSALTCAKSANPQKTWHSVTLPLSRESSSRLGRTQWGGLPLSLRIRFAQLLR